MNNTGNVLKYLISSFLLLVQISLAAQDSLNGSASFYVKSIEDSTIREIRVVELAADGSIKSLHAIHSFNQKGKISRSKMFHEIPIKHQLNRVYQYDTAGISETELIEGRNWVKQEIDLFYKNIQVEILRIGKPDTSGWQFEKAKSIAQCILDTVKLTDDQKISRISLGFSSNDSLHITITKADLSTDGIYTEVSKGNSQDSVVWKYAVDGALTKTFYGADRNKYKTVKFSKEGRPIFEEHFGSPFNFVIEATYTEDGRMKEKQIISNNGIADKRWTYIYNDTKLIMIEEYSSLSKTKSLRYDYSFEGGGILTR